jgi:hypothetical protein
LADQPHTVYLVGEGNFEYSRLLQLRHPEWIVKATEYEGADQVFRRARAQVSLLVLANYHLAEVDKRQTVDDLERDVHLGVIRSTLQFNVDATKLSQEGTRTPRRYDELRWIFPHAGGGGGSPVKMHEYVTKNGPMLTAFFVEARTKLVPRGVVKIALKRTPPYTFLDLFAMAKAAGFQMVTVKNFKARGGFVHSVTGSEVAVSSSGETSYKFEMLAQVADGAGLVRPPELPVPPPLPPIREPRAEPAAVPARGGAAGRGGGRGGGGRGGGGRGGGGRGGGGRGGGGRGGGDRGGGAGRGGRGRGFG